MAYFERWRIIFELLTFCRCVIINLPSIAPDQLMDLFQQFNVSLVAHAASGFRSHGLEEVRLNILLAEPEFYNYYVFIV